MKTYDFDQFKHHALILARMVHACYDTKNTIRAAKSVDEVMWFLTEYREYTEQIVREMSDEMADFIFCAGWRFQVMLNNRNYQFRVHKSFL